MTTHDQTFAQMARKCALYAQHLQDNHHSIAKVMTAYQSYAVTADEIARSVECLNSLDEIKHFLTRRTNRVCTFFPLNLPVYSLVLFAVIPSLIADEVYLRPPQKMIPVFEQLLTSLGLPEHFSNVKVSFTDREVFVKDFVADADVIIFTGKESNARNVLQKTKKDSLFLFNGWGCNPIVVASDADIELAATKAAEAKLFNSGQDCAGPDNILVHTGIADHFLTILKDKVNQAKVGDYSDPDVLVGRIAEESALVRLASFLLKHQDNIVFGGNIDFGKTIVHPTMIVENLSEQTNYEEFFSPIFYVNIYDNDAQLATYFDHPAYAANDMYISLFGSSTYVNSMKTSIIYKEQTILDVERGNSAYGGYSYGASFVSSHGKLEARPILVPKEMSQFLAAKSPVATKLSYRQQKQIHKDIATAQQDYFGSNLIFGFVFGSVAKCKASTSSDIDTMVVVRDDNPSQKDSYLIWLRKYHAELGLTFDPVFPVEYVTLAHLKATLDILPSAKISIGHISEHDYDAMVWTTILCGIKQGISGDQELLHRLAKSVGKWPKIWKAQMVEQIERRVEDCIDPNLEGAMRKIRKMGSDEIQKRFVGFEYLSQEQREYSVRRAEEEFRGLGRVLLGLEK